MANKQTIIGGDRLGAGGKRNVYLHGYERSNHDLSHAWRSTMASGTLVPFMNVLGLPGDTFVIISFHCVGIAISFYFTLWYFYGLHFVTNV